MTDILAWARQLAAIAHNGLHYAADPFDTERYQQVHDIATDMAATNGDLSADDVRETLSAEQGYMTPKVAVRGVVFNRAGDMLFVREDRLDAGKWTLPGGWADIGEGPAATTEREVLEEAGYRVRATKLLWLYDKLQHDHPPTLQHSYILFFLCELLSENPVPSPQGDIETSAPTWFAEADLPADENLSRPRVSREALLRFFDHYRDPSLPTDFD